MSLPSWERGLKYTGRSNVFTQLSVAPLVGAWIEIIEFLLLLFSMMSLPSWERGLKYFWCKNLLYKVKSLPSWERGLKLYPEFNIVPS